MNSERGQAEPRNGLTRRNRRFSFWGTSNKFIIFRFRRRVNPRAGDGRTDARFPFLQKPHAKINKNVIKITEFFIIP